MSNELSILKGAKALVNSSELQEARELSKGIAQTLGGSAGGFSHRISIKGGKFREIVGGEQVNVSRNDTLEVVVLSAAPMARSFYESEYVEGEAAPPTCWSDDAKTPHRDVLASNRQAKSCQECPQNIKGSGKNDSRACRYHQRLAVAVVTEDVDTWRVHQIQLPATSIFGDGSAGNMGMQAYARMLNGQDCPIIAVVTEMRFDEDAATPKLYFRPTRVLERDELAKAIELSKSEDAKAATAFTVAQVDGITPNAVDEDEEDEPAPVAKKPAPKKRAPDPEPEEKPAKKASSNGFGSGKKAAKDEEEVEEPRKVPSAKDTDDTDEDPDLSDLLNTWDDDE